MKNIILPITFLLGATIFIHAQIPPQAFNYSAVARNAEGNPIASGTIGLQITILKTSTAGTEVYKENHSVTLHAKTAESVVNGGGNGFTHYVGELYGGGVVFHVYKGADGNEHGLIVSLTDLGLAPWGLEGTDVPNCESKWNGQANTSAILNTGGLATDAAGLCAAYNGGGYNDWYLPSICELNMLWNNLYDENRILSQTSNAMEIPMYGVSYWSSTETCTACGELLYVWFFEINGYGRMIWGDASNNTSFLVRAVRVF